MEFRKVEFLAQIDNSLARKDYQRGGRCIRFMAIKKEDVFFLSNDDGIPTYTIDLSYWDFKRNTKKHILRDLDDEEENFSWFYIKGVVGERINSGYFYKTFSRDEPEYFSLIECSSINSPIAVGNNINKSKGKSNNFTIKSEICLYDSEQYCEKRYQWDFYSFHVGQGMCSFLTDGKTGFLLDAGAGTPIRRGEYIKNNYNHIKNDLWKLIEHIDNVFVVISHPDSDHWRLLAWDVRIAGKINNIYIPHDTKSITWIDSEIKKKVKSVSENIYFRANNCVLYVFRSNPSKITDNNDCLVCLYRQGNGKYILQSGDYVYSEMQRDSNLRIKNLSNLDYNAVIVPHHGDAASSFSIFPASGDSASAFFSAGDHLGYNHPTWDSLIGHMMKGYNLILDNMTKEIKAVKLN